MKKINEEYLKKRLELNKKLRKEFIEKVSKLPEKRQKTIYEYILKRSQKHRFHIVSPSPWPICAAFSAFILVIGLISWMHKYPQGGLTLFIGVICVLLVMFFWFRDIIREAVFCGYHTEKVQLNLRYGFALFIVSEVMFFFGFFWALLHFILCPSIFGGNIWPPEGIVNFFIAENITELAFYDIHANYFFKNYSHFFSTWTYSNFLFVNNYFYFASDNNYFLTNSLLSIQENEELENIEKSSKTFLIFADPFGIEKTFHPSQEKIHKLDTIFHINLYSSGLLINPKSVPLLNTVILLSSGVFLTLSHVYLKIQKFLRSIYALIATIIFGIYFFICQMYEYKHASFSINDGVYGSTFYMLTGFHGFHVFIGTVFLIVCLGRYLRQHFTPMYHFGYEAAIWYWHFVDVVWILLFFLVYYWPSIFYFKETHYYVTPDGLFINQPVTDLNKFFYLTDILKDKKNASYALNRQLIELVLLYNESPLLLQINKKNLNSIEQLHNYKLFFSLLNEKNKLN